jgi:hypothetical protein
MTEKPEISFQANGKTYIVSMSINAMCEVETKLQGQGFPQFLEGMASPEAITMKSVRLLFWGSLIDHHPEITVTEAGELLFAAGGLGGALEKVMTAITASGAGLMSGETAGSIESKAS